MDELIEKILSISTSHIKPETMRRLETNDFEWLVSYRKPNPRDDSESFGAFVLITDLDLDSSSETADIPKELLNVLRYAESFDCAWVMFDCDAPVCGDLPTYDFDWEADDE